MAEITNFLDVFRAEGVHPVLRGATSHEQSDVSYTLLTSGTSPLLATTINGNADTLPSTDRRIVDEIKRVADSQTFDAIDSWKDDAIPLLEIRKAPHIINMLLGNPHLYNSASLKMVRSELMATLTLCLDKDADDIITPRIEAIAGSDEIEDPVFLTDSIICSRTGNVMYETHSVGDNFHIIPTLLQPFPVKQLDTYLSLFLSYLDNINPVYCGKSAIWSSIPEKAVPTVVLEKVAADQALYLRVANSLESLSIPIDSRMPLSRVASLSNDDCIIVRDIESTPLDQSISALEKMVFDSAPSRQARKDVFTEGDFFIIPAETASPFLIGHLHEMLSRFRLIGSEKLKEYKVTPAMPKIKLKLSSGIDFLEGDAEVEVGNDKFSLADFLNQFTNNRYVKLSDGNRAILDDKYMSRLQRIFDNRDRKGHIKISFFDLPEVEKLIESKISGKFANNARKVFEGFNKISGKKIRDINVKADLRPYQTDGVAWLEYLYDNNLGGCLADDMGLGKTLQTISLLSRIYPASDKPSLVIMPRSLLFNWENELKRFAPQLEVSTYYGPNRNADECMRAQVVLTTYAMIRNDIERLMEMQFDTVILDESQNIKNVTSQTTHAVMLLNANHRFALSGTPMENNLTEIYSLFRFLNPTMFGSAEAFNSRYTYPIQKTGDPDAMQSLRLKIYPFMLRRMKKDVLLELPDRIEQEIFVEMSEKQQKLYDSRRIAFRQEIKGTIASEGIAKAQFVMFQALNELRRIASVPESMSDGTIRSPKINELMDSLSSAVSNGHKSVVFFNYIAGLELVGAELDKLGINFETMTGSTSTAARKKIVTRFQNDPGCMVLLMTLKVGGVGLNLTAADTVYIFEPWWNRAAEEQAINRLHRIGQKATVTSYSIITIGTIEEKIRLLQQQKTELFDRLIGSDSASSKQLSKEDIDFILS